MFADGPRLARLSSAFRRSPTVRMKETIPMPRIRLSVPIVITMLIAVVLLTTSIPGFSQPVQAAPNEQPAFEIHTVMVPKGWSLIPSGLGPGDSFRLLFVTDGTVDASTNDVGRYNIFVQNEAKKNTTFRDNMQWLFTALVSVYNGIDARGNTKTRKPEVGNDPGSGSPIYWVGGQKVADSYADFYDHSWDSREARNSRGVWLNWSKIEIWTGSTHEGTRAYEGLWSVDLGSPPDLWNFFRGTTIYALLGSELPDVYDDQPGDEIHGYTDNNSDSKHLYGISPIFKVRSTTGPKPVIAGPTDTVTGPFDVTVTFPDDYTVSGMTQSDITISGGTLSNFRHTAGVGTPTGDRADETGDVYTVTVTPSYAPSIYDSTTVSLSIGAGAVTDPSGWASVASDTYAVQSARVERVVATIPFDDSGVGTVPKSWYLIPSTDLEPGDSFRLLFVTSDKKEPRSSNIADYNSFVQTAAARNDLLKNFSGRFRVLGSTQTVHAIDNSGTRGTGFPIYWVDGPRAAKDYPDFYDGSWESRTGVDEQSRGMAYNSKVWTGTRDNGERSANPLGPGRFGWIVNTYSALGRGQPFATATTDASGDPGHFYALSPVLEIAEPGGL